MKDDLIKLMLLLGIKQASIDAIKAKYDQPDFAIDDATRQQIIDEAMAHNRGLLENDKEFISGIKGSEAAKQKDIFERKLKQQFGLTADEVKDLDTSKIIEAAHKKATTTGTATLDELNENLTKANARIKELEDVEIPKVKGEVESEKKLFKINQKLFTHFNTSYVDDKKESLLRVTPEAAQTAVMAVLSGKYDIVLNDAGDDFEFREKGTGMKPKSADGTKLLTSKDIIGEQMKSFQFIKESNAPDDPTKVKPPVGTVKDTTPEEEAKLNSRFPGLKAAEEHAKTLSENKPK